MNTRDTILGIVVLLLLVGGVFWARGCSEPRPREDSERAPTARTASDANVPDVTRTDAHVDIEDVRVLLSVAPRPPAAFVKNRFRVRAERDGVPVPIENGRISFEMTMAMGDHRYALAAGEDGWLEAEVVLPFCPSGNSRWYVMVDGTAGSRPISARFQFDLTRRESAPMP